MKADGDEVARKEAPEETGNRKQVGADGEAARPDVILLMAILSFLNYSYSLLAPVS